MDANSGFAMGSMEYCQANIPMLWFYGSLSNDKHYYTLPNSVTVPLSRKSEFAWATSRSGQRAPVKPGRKIYRACLPLFHLPHMRFMRLDRGS